MPRTAPIASTAQHRTFFESGLPFRCLAGPTADPPLQPCAPPAPPQAAPAAAPPPPCAAQRRRRRHPAQQRAYVQQGRGCFLYSTLPHAQLCASCCSKHWSARIASATYPAQRTALRAANPPPPSYPQTTAPPHLCSRARCPLRRQRLLLRRKPRLQLRHLQLRRSGGSGGCSLHNRMEHEARRAMGCGGGGSVAKCHDAEMQMENASRHSAFNHQPSQPTCSATNCAPTPASSGPASMAARCAVGTQPKG